MRKVCVQVLRPNNANIGFYIKSHVKYLSIISASENNDPTALFSEDTKISCNVSRRKSTQISFYREKAKQNGNILKLVSNKWQKFEGS